MASSDDNVVPHPASKTPAEAFAAVVTRADRLELRRNDKNQPSGCLENVVKILLSDERWTGVLVYNEFGLAIEKENPPPFDQPTGCDWSDADDDELDLWLSQAYNMRAGKEVCGRAVGIVARRATYHPVRDYLGSLEWDRVPRLPVWLVGYVGAQLPHGDVRTSEYYTKAGQWWLISAVARIYRPGCKADHVLMLEGAQGIGKSSALRMLFGQWFSDTPLKIGDKDSYVALRGVWGYELAELDSLNRAETSASKAFFTSPRDKYRPPYGKRDMVVPRQVVFAGTVNHDQYLRDDTGNRRYWPIRCGQLNLRGNDDCLELVRDQLWAEAKHRFDAGELWYPTSMAEAQLLGEKQSERYVGDVWEDLIRDRTAGKTEVTMAAIFADILNIEPAKMTQPDQMRVGKCMRRLGWTRRRVRERYELGYAYSRVIEPRPEAEGDDDIPF